MRSAKIPEASAVAPTPSCGEPADTMQKLKYGGQPRPRGDMSVQTGDGSSTIPYQGGSAVLGPAMM